MRTMLIALVLALLGVPLVAATPAAALQLRSGYDLSARARIWVEGERDFYRRGDRLPIRFSTSEDAYVAVIHIDPDGNLEFLYPASPWDDEYVQGGRVYSATQGAYGGHLLVRGGGGIGYLYIVAAPVPLDYGSFRRRGFNDWDWSYAGRGVRGDPFWALEQLTRMLVPDWGYVPHAADYVSYYVGGRTRYPSYACDSGWGGQYGWNSRPAWGWNSYASSCDRLELFLRERPYYFDARRYHGDRRSTFREYGQDAPRHGYKEPAEQRGWSGSAGRARQPARESGEFTVPRRSGTGGTRVRPEPRPPQGREPEGRESSAPAQRRPTLERRPTEPSARPARPRGNPPPVRREPAPRRDPAPRAEPPREGSGAATQDKPRDRPEGAGH